jgi:rhamnulokinase
MSRYLAFDLGAESGRAILGTLEAQRITLEDLHRFANTPVRVRGSLYWDTLRLWYEIQQGLAVAGREKRIPLDGIGVDTWGVDFALLGLDGTLIENARHYRDTRTNGMLETVFKIIPRDEIFAHTGVQFMQINTLYQLYAMRLGASRALACAKTLLMMPDLFNYWLTGVAKCELTVASTSQFYNPRLARWAVELFDRLYLPKTILPEVVPPGTRLGPLLREVAESGGLGAVPVYATGCHDTASAVAAVPASGDSWCYISSGTWSLMGVELDAPVIDNRSLALNLTNEMGAGGKTRLLKNIAGLWLLQECRRAWALAGKEYSYEELAALASNAHPFSAVLDPDAFLEPGDMPAKIRAYCQLSGQTPPDSVGTVARTILESLAFRYREVLESLETLLGRKLETIHIVGGGSRNRTLNQFVADATNRTVIAGPSEATALGNVLIQAIGAGELSGLAAAREMVGRSVTLETFTPKRAEEWQRAYERFLCVVRRC